VEGDAQAKTLVVH